MLRRLATGTALAAVAAVVLVGCTPPVNDLTDEQLLVEASETFDGFYEAVDKQFAAGQASSEAFERFATPALGNRWASDIQAALDAGTSSRGVLAIVNIEMRERSANGFRVSLCTDGANLLSTGPNGEPIAPSGRLPWGAAFVAAADGTSFLIDQFQPSEDAAICDSQ